MPMRYPVTKITAEVTDPYSGRPIILTLEGEGVLTVDNTFLKPEGKDAYEQNGRHMMGSMNLTSEKVTPRE